MSYTPAFKKVLDEVQTLLQLSQDPEQNIQIIDIQEHFKKRCLELGPWERLQNLYKIRPKRAIPGVKTRTIFFKPNRMQTEFYLNRTTRDLVLKMRQGGVTTFSCLIALDMALFTEGVNTAIMAHVQPAVKKFFVIIKRAFKEFQKDWGDLYPVNNTTDNVTELVIKETGSTLVVCTDAKGLTLDFLHISEAAFVPYERISESIEAVPLSCWVVMETTPDVPAGYFYELWALGIEKPQEALYKNHFFPWWYQYPEPEDYPQLKLKEPITFSPREQNLIETEGLTNEAIAWLRIKITESGGDEGEFRRKYPEDPTNCWLSGTNSVFPGWLVENLMRNRRDPAFVGDLQLS